MYAPTQTTAASTTWSTSSRFTSAFETPFCRLTSAASRRRCGFIARAASRVSDDFTHTSTTSASRTAAASVVAANATTSRRSARSIVSPSRAIGVDVVARPISVTGDAGQREHAAVVAADRAGAHHGHGGHAGLRHAATMRCAMASCKFAPTTRETLDYQRRLTERSPAKRTAGSHPRRTSRARAGRPRPYWTPASACRRRVPLRPGRPRPA